MRRNNVERLLRALLQPECQDCAHPRLSANQLSALFIRLRRPRNARNAMRSTDGHAVFSSVNHKIEALEPVK